MQQVTAFDTYACSMLRLDTPCGNDATTLFISSALGGRTFTVAICDGCLAEYEQSGEQTTAYWRKKQREWRVR
jgi:hypothetical protein